MRYLAYYFLVGLAMLAAIGYARAQVIDTKPRVMSGVFCNQPEDIKAVLDNRKLRTGAVELVNQDSVKCVLHDGSESVVLVTAMKFIRTDTFDGDTLYLYEATVEGFVFGGIPKKIDPLPQYVYTFNALHPSHKSDDA